MNKNSKRRHAQQQAEHLTRRRNAPDQALFKSVSSEKGMAQEICHNIGPDGKRSSITRYAPAPSAKRSAPYVRTFKANDSDK